ncbi:exonuclease family [Cryptosporidium sp. chipmunk genotype I]|uniref:exonuclease family n=1 Tax=Cryptosporidium sp. chipmunk genotype I TaxID=1280935 RepID=UPI00351A0E39|nr:exonuclease family [Cryptosporidium sp. chipmunk genotype I]
MNKKALPRAISIDCEMVGCGENGHISVLGRIAVVDDKLKLLMDAFVKPSMRVTNFRTKWSGLTWDKLKFGESFESIQKKFLQIVEHYRKESSSGLVFVGHDISNDFQVLKWTPPESEIRDTCTYFPLRKLLIKSLLEKGEITHHQKEGFLRQKPSLRSLSKHVLNVNIQQGSHCPWEDAKSTMMLYLMVRERWEALVFNRNSIIQSPTTIAPNNEQIEDLGEAIVLSKKKKNKKKKKDFKGGKHVAVNGR